MTSIKGNFRFRIRFFSVWMDLKMSKKKLEHQRKVSLLLDVKGPLGFVHTELLSHSYGRNRQEWKKHSQRYSPTLSARGHCKRTLRVHSYLKFYYAIAIIIMLKNELCIHFFAIAIPIHSIEKNRNRVINLRCEWTLTHPLSICGALFYEDESLCTSGTLHISIRRRLFMYPWGRVIKTVLFGM